jgi:hypothetical protein
VRIGEHASHHRRESGRARTVTSSLAIVGVCVAMAVPAGASVSTNSHDVKVHRFAKGSTTAQCPAGSHVSFGGVAAEFQPPDGQKYVLPAGVRRTADDKLTVYGFNNSRGAEGHLTAYAYCDRGAVPAAVEQSASSGDGGASVVATCPVGTVLVGGGFDGHPSPRHHDLIDSLERISSRQWRATSTTLTAEQSTLTAIAYCARGVAPKLYSATVHVSGHSAGTARASCPTGTALVFGGLRAQKTGAPYEAAHTAQVEAFSWTAPTPTQWVVSAYNVGSRTGTLTALAYCR